MSSCDCCASHHSARTTHCDSLPLLLLPQPLPLTFFASFLLVLMVLQPLQVCLHLHVSQKLLQFTQSLVSTQHFTAAAAAAAAAGVPQPACHPSSA
jgi:hypothetical protein